MSCVRCRVVAALLHRRPPFTPPLHSLLCEQPLTFSSRCHRFLAGTLMNTATRLLVARGTQYLPRSTDPGDIHRYPETSPNSFPAVSLRPAHGVRESLARLTRSPYRGPKREVPAGGPAVGYREAEGVFLKKLILRLLSVRNEVSQRSCHQSNADIHSFKDEISAKGVAAALGACSLGGRRAGRKQAKAWGWEWAERGDQEGSRCVPKGSGSGRTACWPRVWSGEDEPRCPWTW